MAPNYSPVTRRRLRDGETAMGVSTTGKTRAELITAKEAVCDGIRALQSTDDNLGEEMYRQVYEQEKALFAKLKVLEDKIAMTVCDKCLDTSLDTEPCGDCGVSYCSECMPPEYHGCSEGGTVGDG